MPVGSGHIHFPSSRNECAPEKVSTDKPPTLAFARYGALPLLVLMRQEVPLAR